MRRIRRKTRVKRLTRKKSSNFSRPSVFILGIFFLGIIAGISGILLTQAIKSRTLLSRAYYSPEVFEPPKDIKSGFTLGTSVKNYHIPILLYHYVEFNKDARDTIRMSLTIRRDIFENQVQDLLNNDYTILTVSEAGQIIEGKKIIPKKPVVLTFDDGYRDFYTDVFPILQFYNVKATLFLVSNFIDRSNNLTSNQIKEIVKSGLVEIGGHTMNHISIPSLNNDLAREEIAEDKKYLEEKFGIRIVSFAYPYGQFNQEAVDLVKKAGYLQAVSVVKGEEQGMDNRYFLYRIRPGNATGEYLDNFLAKK